MGNTGQPSLVGLCCCSADTWGVCLAHLRQSSAVQTTAEQYESHRQSLIIQPLSKASFSDRGEGRIKGGQLKLRSGAMTEEEKDKRELNARYSGDFIGKNVDWVQGFTPIVYYSKD